MHVTSRASEQGALTRSPAERPAGACLNCGAPRTGHFCASCGQRDIPAYPTTRELASDAVAELSGWDGRLATTVRTLLRRPGTLTREFLEGRRARYISPLRLYLAASVTYFVLAAGAPDVKVDSERTLFLGLRLGASAGSSNSAQELTPEERAAFLAQIDSVPALLQPLVRKSIDDPGAVRRGLFQTMPRIFFVLLPAFAAIVSLFYRRRKFPEHLYFAIHLHAFVFLALAFLALTKYTGSSKLAMIAGLAVFLAIPIHATLAFRRVYGGSMVKTLAKEAGIGVLYLAVGIAAFMAMLLWVSARG
jgi:hypothetical protein